MTFYCVQHDVAYEAMFGCHACNEQNAKQNDPVNHPSHYTAGAIECIDAIAASMTPDAFRGYCKGNALKYIWRYEHKGEKESLQKAIWYLNRLISTL